MRYNLMFPMRAVKHWNRWCEGAGIGDVARLVEEAGFDAFSMSEHPYPDQEWLARGGHHAFDPFVSLSFAAAATTRIRLITYLLVSGYRNPYLTAKAAASFDLLSGGRFTLGTGAGYLKAEFEAHHEVDPGFRLALESFEHGSAFASLDPVLLDPAAARAEEPLLADGLWGCLLHTGFPISPLGAACSEFDSRFDWI